jgi:hypothetical protein
LAAIVFGLVILNPFKFDWQQRISLFIAISAFAYFLAHTVHKPKIAELAASDARVAALEQQVKDLQARKEQSEAEAATEKQEQGEIRSRLSELATEGVRLRNEWRQAISGGQTELQQRPYVEGVQKWHLRVMAYLKTIPRGEAYLARFEAGVRGLNSYPSGIYQSGLGAWDQLMSDLTKLNEFIADSDLGKF